nr:ABC transporter ATP-binding protein [uncultured Cellulosilyticum sp.]
MSNNNRPPQRKGSMGGHGPMRGMGPGEKAKDFKGTMQKLMSYLGQFKIGISIVAIFAIASTVFSIVGPKILGKATTKLFEGVMGYVKTGTMAIDYDFIGKIIGLLLVIYIISAVFAYIQSWIMSGVSQKVTYNLRKEISEKINRMPIKYFDTKTHGEVLSRITNDVDVVSQTLGQSLTQIITSIVTVLGVLVMMLSISPLMTLVAIIVIPLSLVVVMGVVKRSQKYFKAQQEYLGHLNGHIEEMYSGHIVVKAFNGEEDALETFNKYNETLYESSWKSQFLSGMMMPLMGFVGNLGYVIVCILGGFLAVKNAIEVGDIQAFIQYMRSFTQPMGQLANISNTLQSTAAAAERVFEFLDEDEEVAETTTPVSLKNPQGAVSFENVHFGYTDTKTIINDFTADIKPGQTVAIVGPTGAGKTTIVKLLMRFYELQSGRIKVDGHDICDFTRADLRDLFGMVLQDTWLYNASIMDNIRYSKQDATEEEIIAAAKAAHVDEFVHTLPDGYNMILNEEASNVSQGQKQLLTIARAILRDPKILILDEATSSVDTRTEVLIQKAMENLMRGRTSFVIAHRLSTIRNADLILVMKDGDIIEQGTHEELLAKGDFYANLYNSQFEVA